MDDPKKRFKHKQSVAFHIDFICYNSIANTPGKAYCTIVEWYIIFVHGVKSSVGARQIPLSSSTSVELRYNESRMNVNVMDTKFGKKDLVVCLDLIEIPKLY
jgi:hypothetical protein